MVYKWGEMEGEGVWGRDEENGTVVRNGKMGGMVGLAGL